MKYIKKSSNKTTLKNWARNCHFDGAIAVKEVKGKKWMDTLSYLENKFDFNIDDYNHKEAWEEILKAINQLSEEEAHDINMRKYQI